MSHPTNDLFREEVRGIFVLGVIATLLTLREFGPNPVLLANPAFALRDLELYFSGIWGLYIFFAAIAVSDDWIWPRLAKMCHVAAKTNFHVGIAVLLATFVMIAFSASGPNVAIWAGIITALLSAIFLTVTSPKPTNEKAEKTAKQGKKNQ